MWKGYTSHARFEGGEWWDIPPSTWKSSGMTLNPRPKHTGTFGEYASAGLYYGSFGLLDPKMPIEAYGYKKLFNWAGWKGYLKGAGLSMSGGFVLAGVVGLVFDPADRHKGGLMQTQAWKDITHKKDKKFLHFR